MATLNKCMFIGRVGKDPDIRTVGEAKNASFSLAVSEKFRDRSGETRENTEWVNIVAWRKTAEFCESYVKKGQELYIEGKLRTREYTDASNTKKYITEVVADNIQLLGGRKEQNATASPAANQGRTPIDEVARQQVAKNSHMPAPEPEYDEGVDDLPF